MKKEKTIYCGSGKKMNDNWFKVTINPDKLKNYIDEFEGNKFIRLNINVKEEADQYGKDVSISVDTWKPDTQQKKQSDYQPMTKTFIQSEDDLPF